MAEKVEFYRETEFKDTEIGRISKEWEIKKLSEFLHLENGKRPNIVVNGKFPVYGANGIMGYTDAYMVDDDIVIIGRVGAAGEVHLARGKIWLSDNAIYGINKNRTKIYLDFIYYVLKYTNLSRFASKTTHPIITQTILENFNVPVPPLAEQQKIAEILSTVDEAIQKTDDIIAKTERLKKGLMQELLIKGIGHKEFKDTEIGRIPKGWEVMVAADVADYINGYPFSPTDWKMHGIPIIRIQNLNDPNAEFNCFDGKIDDIYKIKNGDLLFSWSASIGIYIWKHGDAVLNQHIFKVVPKANINKLFLYYDLLLAIEQLKGRVHGSTMKHFQKNELKTTFIPIPPLEEQQKIAEILSTIDEAIQKTDDIIAKTELLSRCIMVFQYLVLRPQRNIS